MARNYSPNHPAVRSSLDRDGMPRPLTVRERRQAMNARAGRSNALPRSRAIVGFVSILATFPAMAWGEAHGQLVVAFVPLAFGVYCLAPWMRKDIEEVRQWR
jgi:hypothetical protein